ncbi:MAG: sulfatase-like hydrolase/transferase [Planctomycetes bacterium]|nr:sulfatase-like hydrolase/transferase [Planctomycetota bacterium]
MHAEHPSQATGASAIADPRAGGLRRAWPWLVGLVLVVALFRTLDGHSLWYVEHGEGTQLEVFGRCVLYWASGLWIASLLVSRSRLVHVSATLLVALSLAVDQCYVQYINGVGFVPHEMFLALTNPGTLLDSVAMYADLTWPIFTVSIVGAFGLALLVRRLLLTVPVRVSMTGAFVLIPLVLVMNAEGYGDSGHVAAPLRIPAFLAFYAIEPTYPEREDPYLEPVAPPRIDHLVLIVDESVMGSHLGLNGYVRDTTPRVFELARRGFARSLGICSAACNYSVGSFLTLLSGATAEELAQDPERFLRKPSLFAYAERSGYESLFLNSQDYLPWVAGDQEDLGNGLRIVDVDRVRLPCHAWDHSLLDALCTFVSQHERTFTIIAKRGAHYPYYDKCPKEHVRYEPTLTGPAWSDAFLPNVNAYDNATAWTFDDYLATLHEGLERTGKSVLVIYTSDHGQVLPGEPLEGFTFRRTHAMLDTPSTSVVDVPLVLLATREARPFLERVPAGSTSRLTHFEIFPTVLDLFGYDRAQVERLYGRGLWQPVPDDVERVFFEGKPIQTVKPFTLPDNRAKFAAALEQQAAWDARLEKGSRAPR